MNSNYVKLLLVACMTIVGGCGFPSAEDAPIGDADVPAFLPGSAPIATTAGNQEILLQWPDLPNASSYTLYWSTQADMSPETADIIETSDTLYRHTGLRNGTQYFYAISALSAQGRSPLSEISSATPELPQLSAPNNFRVIQGDGRNTLYWDNVDGASSYTIHWATEEEATLDDPRIDFVQSPFVHEDLSNGTLYQYVVVANLEEKAGIPSAVQNARPQKRAALAPTELQVSRNATSLSLDWALNGSESFNIYWSTAPGVSENSTVFQHKIPPFNHVGIEPGIPYYYRIQAVNSTGSGSLSFEFEVPGTISATQTISNSPDHIRLDSR